MRLRKDLEIIGDTLRTYKAFNGQIVAKSRMMELQLNEMRNIFPSIMAELKNLKIKAGRVETYTNTVINGEKHIKTFVRDSVRLKDSIIVKNIDYKDMYYTVKGTMLKDTLNLHIKSYDTITQIVYRGARTKPYLWIFSPRRLEQVISCKNPNNHIVYNRVIRITK